MKRILITGANSYIGTSFAKWLAKEPMQYVVDKISLRDPSWKDWDFSPYDVVLHVAGIVHQKETRENESLFYQVNRDLAFQTAKKAKADGVKQFIFMSTMSVYGIEEGVITTDTPLRPKTLYGRTKLEAEQLIHFLADEQFKVTILRPPMVYGKGCKGNYPRLAKLARTFPFFPDVKNHRSMIYIDHLCEYIRYIIDKEISGVLLPQNKDYANITELVRMCAWANNRSIIKTRKLNPVITYLMEKKTVQTVNKVFGTLVYDAEASNMSAFYDDATYTKFSFEKTIQFTEQEEAS